MQLLVNLLLQHNERLTLLYGVNSIQYMDFT